MIADIRVFSKCYSKQTVLDDTQIAWAVHELEEDVYDCNETTGWINLTGRLGDRKEGALNIRLKLTVRLKLIFFFCCGASIDVVGTWPLIKRIMLYIGIIKSLDNFIMQDSMR